MFPQTINKGERTRLLANCVSSLRKEEVKGKTRATSAHISKALENIHKEHVFHTKTALTYFQPTLCSSFIIVMINMLCSLKYFGYFT